MTRAHPCAIDKTVQYRRIGRRHGMFPAVLLALTLLGCGGSTNGTGGIGAVSGGGAGECVMEVTGAVTHQLVGTTDGRGMAGQSPQASMPSFMTRHWMSPASVEASGTAQARAIETGQAQVATLAADMPPLDATQAWMQSERDFAAVSAAWPPWFSLDCGARDDPSVLIRFHSWATRPEDLPMRPASHTIPLVDWSTAGPRLDVPGIEATSISISGDTDGGGNTIWVLAEPGRFEIDRFDRSEVAGRFSLVARPMEAVPGDTDRHVQVTGRFAFRCPAGADCDPD